jgi:hypothetical protein
VTEAVSEPRSAGSYRFTLGPMDRSAVGGANLKLSVVPPDQNQESARYE